MTHLTAKTREIVINSTVEEKIHHLRKQKWIRYPQAEKIMDKLQDLLGYPEVDRMPNILIVGATNNGKTAIIRRFLKKNDPYVREGDYDIVIAPVLLCRHHLSLMEEASIIRF